MGEYARRVQDGQEVKIGTCETLYYLRYDQRKQVDYNFGKEKWFWRIPTPKEDGILPGDFETKPLSKGEYVPYMLKVSEPTDAVLEWASEHPGIAQTRVEKLGLFDINLIDHVIIGNDGRWYSFAEYGK